MYTLGIDLGTTFTAAATWRAGHAEIASLGSRAAVIPSVVLLRQDETVLTGETAHRRGLSEPHRVSREFKRRLGDTTPILLGGVPYSAEALMGKLLRSVVDEVSRRQGEQPSTICVSHPANWGPYKKDLLAQAVRLSNIDQRVLFTTEPEAAAVFYTQQQRVEPGAVVAVYDLGGGTFDAAVLRKTASGFEILGQPEGIERLGGIDFDAAVFSHVARSLGGKLAELDEDDPAAIAAVARLREECIEAKEVLSSDTDATIPVLLPNTSTEVRLTRAELEAMVRPALHSTIEALRRALRSAGVAPEELHSVLLVGGSSRMPLVAQLVGAELGRPVAVDAHPKHAIALGAAWLASGTAMRGAAGAAPATSGRPGSASVPAGAGAAGAVAAGAAVAAAGASAAAARPAFSGSAAVPSSPTSPAPTSPAPVSPAPVSPAPISPAPVSPARPPAAATPELAPTLIAPRMSSGPQRRERFTPAAVPVPQRIRGTASAPPPAPPGVRRPTGPRRRALLVVAAALAMVLAASTVAWAVTRDNDADEDNNGGGGGLQETVTPGTGETPGPVETAAPVGQGTTPPIVETEEPVPPDEECTEEIQSNERWVCLTSAVMQGDQLVIDYDSDFAGDIPNITDGFHLHIYGSDGTYPPDELMGNQAGDDSLPWVIKDDNPAILTAENIAEAVGDQPKVCARIANGDHGLVQDRNGGYRTGNCVRIQ
jgi:actin-like ATPase involved in cell morphogenesis